MARIETHRGRAGIWGKVMTASAPPLMCIRDWDRLHENNRSREIGRLQWVAIANDLSSDSYVELVSHQDGAGHLGAWTALLMLASSRSKPRDGQLVRENGRPHTAESLASLTRLPEELVKLAIARLLEIGLLEVVENAPSEDSGRSSHSGAAKPQEAAPKSQDSAAEGKGTEHHHQEGKRKRKEQKRTEPDGTEGAAEQSTTERSDSLSGSDTAFPPEGDDESKHPEGLYASPEDELKAIYQSKAGEPITLHVLGSIRSKLELTRVKMSDFVEEVRKHIEGKWRNPPGFLLDLAARFVAKTRPAGKPKTAAEAAADSYQCKLCYSRKPGEGIVQGTDGKPVPCVCASPEYVARQRAKGVFPPDSAG